MVFVSAWVTWLPRTPGSTDRPFVRQSARNFQRAAPENVLRKTGDVLRDVRVPSRREASDGGEESKGEEEHTSGKATKRAGAQSVVAVDEGLKARWKEALARYVRARTEETEGWDARYEALGEILDSDPPYFLAGGYKTAAAFLKAEVPDQDERTVRMYIRVARYFDPEDESRFGVAKLDLLLRYMDAAGEIPLVPAKIDPAKRKVKVPNGKGTRIVAFADCSAEDLRSAARVAAARKGKAAPSLPRSVKVVKEVLARAKLASVAVRVRGDRIDLTGIEWRNLASLGAALAAAKLGDKPPA
jgi:hypothetical protein